MLFRSVSSNTALKVLRCGNNQLITLDVSNNTELTRLGCDDNRLTDLDMSRNTELLSLGCSRNQLTSSALNGLFRSLRSDYSYTKNNSYLFYLWIYFNPGTNDCEVNIAEEKGWIVRR